MIRVTDIVKSYGQIAVLNSVNLTIVHKEVVAIVGPSGAGKSTLLQILGTLGKPDSGQVMINDVDVFNLSADELARFRNQQIGFVFQFHHLLPEFTALENVCIPAYIAKKSQKEATARAKELLSYLGLSERLTHKPKELSGGEQQRVAIARAMMNEPAILLADEPSGNLDSHNREEIHQLFFKLRDELNQTIVLVTHDADLANMSDRKLTMRDGRFIN